MQTSASPARPRRVARWALQVLAFFLEPIARPYRRARRELLVRRHRRRLALVEDLLRLMSLREAKAANERARKTILLRPEKFRGIERVCAADDGGCGVWQRFGPLKRKRVGNREQWALVCPNPRCRKARQVLTTTPQIRGLQSVALEEFERTGWLGPAFDRFERAVATFNEPMPAIHLVPTRKGAGEPPAAAARQGEPGEPPAA